MYLGKQDAAVKRSGRSEHYAERRLRWPAAGISLRQRAGQRRWRSGRRAMAGGDSLSLLSRTNCSAVEPLSGLWTPARRKPAIPAVLSIDDGASSAHRSEN